MHVPLRALLCALALLACTAGAATPAYAYDDAGYLAYADRMQSASTAPGTRSAGSTSPARAASTR